MNKLVVTKVTSLATDDLIIFSEESIPNEILVSKKLDFIWESLSSENTVKVFLNEVNHYRNGYFYNKNKLFLLPLDDNINYETLINLFKQ
jgi:hypothetical protein